MENDDAPNNQNSWLLFSLTPQMNIHLPSSHPSSSAPTHTQTIPTNNLFPNYYALHDEPENASYYLPVMEALSTSQPQGGSMPLSLDSMAFNSSYCSAFRSHDLGNFFQASHITQESMAPYGDYLQSLSCVTTSHRTRRTEKVDDQQKQIVRRKSIHTFGQRTSQYRGVTRHRWTGRYEAHLWDNSCKKEGQSRKGRQVYLGGYDREEKAARAYDLAALKYWGPSTHINFPLENYENEVGEMKRMTRQEYVAHLRRKSSGFSRGASIYRGVTRHHQHGRWQARIGRVAGNKDLYLGTFSTQEEAGEAYDIAAIKFRGVNAVTNFDISRYDVEKIMASSNNLSGDEAKRKSTNTGIIIDDNAANYEEGNSNNNNILMHNIN